MRRLPALLGLLIALAVYFALALPQLDLPGLHNDEAAEAGLPASQVLAGRPVAAFREAGIALGGRTFPLMVQEYIGALNVYLALPFLALFGPTAGALRLYTVVVGGATIAVTFGFMAEAFGRLPAFVAALLLAASPSFVFWQRQGVLVSSLTAALAMAALWAGAVWARRGGRGEGGWRWAALIGLLCGAGLYAKLLFIWVILGMAGALAVVNLPIAVRHVWAMARPRPPDTAHSSPGLRALLSGLRGVALYPRTPAAADLAAFAVGLLVGLGPLVAYNLQTGGTLGSIGANLATSFYGVDNLNFGQNLRGRVDQFGAVTEGRDHLWYLGGSFGNPGWAIALRLAGLAIALRAVLRRQRSRLPLALALLLALGVVQSSITVSGLFPTHFAIFAPLWPVIVAAASEIIFNPFYEPMIGARLTTPVGKFLTGGRHLGGLGFVTDAMIVLAFCLGWLWARDVAVTVDYHRALRASGGLGPHSDAVYRLADYLQASGPAPVVAMDWGFAPQVRMLTGDRIVPQEIFGYAWEPDEGFRARLAEALDGPAAAGTAFVFHFPQETIFPRREAFEAMAAERGWRIEQRAVISRRDGAPLFEVVSVLR